MELSASLTSHLIELRRRLLWSFLAMAAGTLICYFFAESIYGFLVKPLADAMGENSSQRLIYTNLTEAFFTYLKVSFFAGVFLLLLFYSRKYGFLLPPASIKTKEGPSCHF
jgi:sec-independent protein translocase protein TatC